MAFARWDPLQDLLTIHERINRLNGPEARGWMPPVDLYETPADYVMTVELPGLSRGDIHIELQEGTLTLRGQRPGHSEGCEQYHRVERGHGQFVRSFSLPQAIDNDQVHAEFADGVLTVRLTKSHRQRRIDID